MDERRQRFRQIPPLNIDVFDEHSGRRLGRIVDLSLDGFMLASDSPPAADSLWHCRLEFDRPVEGIRELHLGADCLWARAAEAGQAGWAGFQIIDLADDQLATLTLLLEYLPA